MAAGFSAISWKCSYQHPSGGFICIFTGNGYIIIGHFGIYKITFKLCTAWPGFYYGSSQVNSICYHQLYNTVLIAFEICRNNYCFRFITNAGKFNLVAF